MTTVTEKWVRDRVGLDVDQLGNCPTSFQHNSLLYVTADVHTLLLPGTVHEKIGRLGVALLGFSRLKCLDLSCNLLTSLDGLGHLSKLETLNLYFNKIGRMQVNSVRHYSYLFAYLNQQD